MVRQGDLNPLLGATRGSNAPRLPFLHQTEKVVPFDRPRIGSGVFGESEADGFAPAGQ